jgi:hypothetical protein
MLRMSNRAEYAFVLAALLGPILHAEDLSNPATAAALVRAVRESENWIHDVNSFYLRLESTWTKTPEGIAARRAELRQQFPDAVLDPNRWTGLRPRSRQWIEIAFDGKRLRYLRDDPNTSLTERVWDGRLAVSHENYMSHHQEHFYLANDPKHIFRYFLGDLSWLRAQPHSFWWQPMDIEQPFDLFGRPDDFRLAGREEFRGTDCRVLEYDTCYGAKGLMFRWHIGVDAPLLRGISHVRNGRLTLQHWLDDYREITPGCWFPMVQGYAFYDPDESGRMYLRSRRDMRIVEIRVNEPLPDAIFHIDLKEGVEVQDHRGDEFRRYIYTPEPPSLIGRPIPDFNDIALDHPTDQLHNIPLLICFCDTNQRPSRHCLRQLADKAAYLSEQGIAVLIIQAGPADQPIVNEHESSAVARIRNHHKRVRFTWGVQSLPWLILTDRSHVVQAEGFSLRELDRQLARIN